jgi:hypothetical protein
MVFLPGLLAQAIDFACTFVPWDGLLPNGVGMQPNRNIGTG